MRRQGFVGPSGEVVSRRVESKVLEGNPLGDPSTRELLTYLPPGYETGGDYPVLFALAGFTSSGRAFANWRNFGESLPERLDRLIHSGTMGPTIVVFPDAFTRLGGNQYLNSTAIGRYADYLVEELVPFVEKEFAVRPGRDHRGLFGKSSGGYGALVHAMLYPDTWGAVACHSGDLYFEYGYLPDFPVAIEALREHGSFESFLEAFEKRQKPLGREIHALMLFAMAATYDPDPAVPCGFRIPFDPETGEMIEARWRAWKRWDPIEMLEDSVAALDRLELLFFDCGRRDQYRLQYGARIFERRLREHGIRFEYEEFDDDHSGLDYRFDVSLPKLYRALQG